MNNMLPPINIYLNRVSLAIILNILVLYFAFPGMLLQNILLIAAVAYIYLLSNQIQTILQRQNASTRPVKMLLCVGFVSVFTRLSLVFASVAIGYEDAFHSIISIFAVFTLSIWEMKAIVNLWRMLNAPEVIQLVKQSLLNGLIFPETYRHLSEKSVDVILQQRPSGILKAIVYWWVNSILLFIIAILERHASSTQVIDGIIVLIIFNCTMSFGLYYGYYWTIYWADSPFIKNVLMSKVTQDWFMALRYLRAHRKQIQEIH